MAILLIGANSVADHDVNDCYEDDEDDKDDIDDDGDFL